MTTARILIVEDERITVMALVLMLRSRHYEICGTSSTGAEALEIAARELPSLALMDINIPGTMDGIDTARELLEKYGVRSIFLSGFPRERMASRLEGLDNAGYLVKPFDLAQLTECLAVALRP